MYTGDVFISYNSEEYSEASTIRSILTANGISCWMAPESIPFGSNYAREIPNAIAGCRVFLLILSQKSQKSRWVALELDRAMNEGKLIYPLQIENCDIVDPFNFMLSQTQRYNAYTEKVNAMKRLVQSLRQILGLPLEDAMTPEEKPADIETKAPEEPEPVIPEPELVVAELEPVIPESEPVVAELEPVIPEPEIVAAEPEPAVPEPESAVEEPEKSPITSSSFESVPEPPAEKADTSARQEEPEQEPMDSDEISFDDLKLLFDDDDDESQTAEKKETENHAAPARNEPDNNKSVSDSAARNTREHTIPSQNTFAQEAVDPDTFEIQSDRDLLIRYTGTAKKVVIPDGVRRIGENAFTDTSVEQVICPASLRHIGRNAFRDCMTLISVKLNEGLEYIGYSAFSSCKNLAEINFPDTLEHIGSFGFSSTALTKLVIPASVKRIDGDAFSCCFNLQSVDLACEEIGKLAFYGDRRIREILLRKTVKRVGKKAFSDSLLASVNIMNKDIELDKKVFHKKAKINYVN